MHPEIKGNHLASSITESITSDCFSCNSCIRVWISQHLQISTHVPLPITVIYTVRRLSCGEGGVCLLFYHQYNLLKFFKYCYGSDLVKTLPLNCKQEKLWIGEDWLRMSINGFKQKFLEKILPCNMENVWNK